MPAATKIRITPGHSPSRGRPAPRPSTSTVTSAPALAPALFNVGSIAALTAQEKDTVAATGEGNAQALAEADQRVGGDHGVVGVGSGSVP